MNSEITNPETRVRLQHEASLQELNSQLLRSDIDEVAKKAKVVRNTALSYLEGCAPKDKTARKIIRAARSIILERENDIKNVA